MPSTYSPALRLEEIANGEQVGTWGDTTNRNLGALIEQAITATTVVDVTLSDKTLLALNGAVDEARSPVLMATGTPTVARTITIPNANKHYVLRNYTEQSVTVNTLAGIGYECLPKSVSQLTVRAIGAGEVVGTTITDVMAQLLRSDDIEAALLGLGAAPLDSPAFTGVPTVPTAAPGTSTDQIASTAFVVANAILPKMILFWPDADVPEGYAICDGDNGTPDLRDRTLIGAGTWSVGEFGGFADSTLPTHSHSGATESTDASHTHTFVTDISGEHNHGGVLDVASGISWDDGNGGTFTRSFTGFAGAHSHSGTTNASPAPHVHTIKSSGEDATNKNYPPFYVGHWIQKLAN